jgi:hypothetical protein
MSLPAPKISGGRDFDLMQVFTQRRRGSAADEMM